MVAERRVVRRVSGFVLLLILGLMLFLGMRHRPVDVEISYDLRGARTQLRALDVSWLGEEGKTVHASFSFSKDVPQFQRHTLNLPRGEYQLTAVLQRRDGRSSIVERSVTVEESGELEIDLVDDVE
ncbi:MAG: hypothetical protein RBU37_18530 [Myxococcota bacterium]|jgi:hypothetical protein|nr:hypothetical protein [Myxococcota bacterium]